MFCQKCGGIMLPKKIDGITVLVCTGCGNKAPVGLAGSGHTHMHLTEKSAPRQKLAIVEHEDEIHPIEEETCPKCSHPRAHSWDIQTRAADEPATRFYKCEKCKHTWRKNK